MKLSSNRVTLAQAKAAAKIVKASRTEASPAAKQALREKYLGHFGTAVRLGRHGSVRRAAAKARAS